MELRHLRYFVAVAEEENVTRAAQRLGIRQPPLSQQIRALETELDVQLFRRKPRGVELTDAGRALFEDAQAILDRVEQALAKAQRTARGEQGTIVVGFTSSAPFHPFVPEVIRSFRQAHPNVSLELQEAGTGELIEAVEGERMDAAFIRSHSTDASAVAVHRLFAEQFLAALPAGHALASSTKPIALTELRNEPLVLYRRQSGPGLYDTILSACQQSGFNPDITQEAPQIVSTLNLVAAGLGITLVPASLRQARMVGVVFRPLKSSPNLTAPLNLACRKVDHSEAAKRFVALVRRTARLVDSKRGS